ncbi:hypothetical protein [Sphaerotilus montanus]|uniref:hypothetical protein n=1 Tax=Sphaerotilus montanus TaxID=522889 RepID=UPI003FA291C8
MRLNKKVRTALAFTAIIVATPTFSQSIKEDSENWQVTSAWVKEITPEQQAHAIFSAFAALNKKTAELIQHNQGWEQLLWATKITACGTSMLAKVSTKNPDIENNLQQVSDLYVAFIRGEKPSGKFVERDEQLRREGISIFNKINQNQYKETAITFKRRLFETDRSLVVYAMMCATPRTN